MIWRASLRMYLHLGAASPSICRWGRICAATDLSICSNHRAHRPTRLSSREQRPSETSVAGADRESARTPWQLRPGPFRVRTCSPTTFEIHPHRLPLYPNAVRDLCLREHQLRKGQATEGKTRDDGCEDRSLQHEGPPLASVYDRRPGMGCPSRLAGVRQALHHSSRDGRRDVDTRLTAVQRAHSSRVTAGSRYDPSRMGLSAPYNRIVRLKPSAGAGSQFDCLSAPGFSCWM